METRSLVPPMVPRATHGPSCHPWSFVPPMVPHATHSPLEWILGVQIVLSLEFTNEFQTFAVTVASDIWGNTVASDIWGNTVASVSYGTHMSDVSSLCLIGLIWAIFSYERCNWTHMSVMWLMWVLPVSYETHIMWVMWVLLVSYETHTMWVL